MFKKAWLIARAVGSIGSVIGYLISRSAWMRMRRIRHRFSSASSSHAGHELRNIVVIGASMAGYHAAKTIAESLLPGSPYRVVGHEHKAFIPYGPYLRRIPEDALRWVRGRAVGITRDSVRLGSGEEIPYEFLIVATGAGATDALPSRVDSDDLSEGISQLKNMQSRIKEAKNVVVVGGGAAGVELATDAKSQYPEKTVVLVHSRDSVMHRFGPGLQKAAMEGLKDLGVEIITGDRLIGEDKERSVVTLRSGKEVECDFLVNCAGQRPNSTLLAELSPNSVTATGHARAKPTMQIDDESLPNVYVCGDVAETSTPNPNSRSARAQAQVAADNVVLAIDGRKPTREYRPNWLEALIKLTLGLDKSVTHIGDFSGTEMLFPAKEKDLALMSGGAWKHMGATPFQDDTESLQRFFNKA
ncbi:hypothetical protein EKO27_g6540 [Xylaria grammica]|uniref:FAD/NAD(P)-binding domain-containing protein n=1 Tax=Xylaria grammica TaxID=363999 RepID=A0A439D296_9PEZI|nr:hypothetical protein EKO27_g6540 [Xylaria grammica]